MDILHHDEHTWIIEDGGVRCFLLEGEEKAALIDTGMTVKNILPTITRLTDKEVLCLNTHADRDHIGSNTVFDTVCIGIHELQHYAENGFDQKVVPLYEDDVIDLGDRRLRVIDLSGHTPGSIGFLDERNRVLISGDPIQRNGRVFMFGAQRSLIGYVCSLERLEKRKEGFDEIWPSHGDLPLDPSLIEICKNDVEDLLEGKLSYEPLKIHDSSVRAYQGKANIYLCDD